ncbi:2060_t:CDS:10 [Dentiscutata heterogama]|uniref:2060_t:CDS:1 n=1 Tax=Dentiscutata heterogama TaxID=1316150 RepID=A0ACA9JZ24_9GLOM|nr:2060_t:CDS:10 [Dentiscutata heterogama]
MIIFDLGEKLENLRDMFPKSRHLYNIPLNFINTVKDWTIFQFHKSWFDSHRGDVEELTYSKATDAFVKSLQAIVQRSSDVSKIWKASSLLADLRASTFLYGNVLRSVLFEDCKKNQRNARSDIDKLWLDVEKILREKMINTGTNIQFINSSCDNIQISNVGNKRTREKENGTPSKKLVNDNPSLNQDVGEHHGEMSSSKDSIVQGLTNIGGIARYNIIFLPEENECSPIKSIFTKEKWMRLEADWQKAEKKTMLPAGSGMNENVAVLFDEMSIVNRDAYSFTEEWSTQWIKLVYNAFLLCFQLPINPLHDGELSEYAYIDRIVNRIIEDIFLDINNVIRMKTGEVENRDSKVQKDSARPLGQRRSVGWEHDAMLVIKVNSVDFQVGFGEVVGNACIRDDKKMIEDREKILKSMQLGLFRLYQLFRQQGVDENDISNAETFGILIYRKTFHFYSMHYVNNLYLVDQFDGFTIPDNSGQLEQLSDILEVMFSFKQRVMNLHRFIQNSLIDDPDKIGRITILGQ